MGRKVAPTAALLALLLVPILASAVDGAPLKAEAASTPPATEWIRTYGGAKNDFGRYVQRTNDGGYIIIGITSSYGAGENDAWLVKTFANGSLQWSQTYGGEHGEAAYSGQQTSDGGYIFAGYTTVSRIVGNRNPHDPDAWIVKTGPSGNTVWSKTFGGETDDAAYSVQQTIDGGYIVAGLTINTNTTAYDAWLVKTDASGNTVWNRSYGTGYRTIYSVKQTVDEGYICAGRSEGGFWLVKTNSTGSLVWSQTYGGEAGAFSAQQTRDGGYIATGTYRVAGSNYDAWLVKTNSSGNVVWNQTYGGPQADGAQSVQQTIDGGYVFGGSNQIGAGNTVAWLVKTNANGAMEWNQTYGGSYGYSVLQTSDEGYVFAGETSPPGTYDMDAFLMKVSGQDTDGDGLPDTWEKNGIDYDNDGTVELKLKDADWQHKDIFVEVDYMEDHRLNAVARDDIIAAFRNAPVKNPDNIDGINLHIEVDDTDNIAHQDSIRIAAYTGYWPDIDSIKKDHFGTASQQGNVTVLKAKSMAYHYCLMIHNWADFNATSGKFEVTDYSGIAEPYGNDFVVSLGGTAETVDEQAGTFMHELGHNLGLQHGGNDSINFKPNYLSIMNYFFQFPTKQLTRPLDYSRQAQSTLNENDLDETKGVGAAPALWPTTVFSAPVWNAASGSMRYVPLPVSTLGNIDWNNNGTDTETSVKADLNRFPQWGKPSSPDELLKGYDDWANLFFKFRDTPDFADGVHSSSFGVDELKWDTVQAMRDSFSQLHEVAVLNVSSSTPVWGQGGTLSVNVTLGNFGSSDENVNATVYANSTLIASSSLIIKSGNLTTVTLPYNGRTLAAGNYRLSATVSPVAQESYTADNTVTGGVISVTAAIPEFDSAASLAAIVIAASAMALVLRKRTKV